MPRFFNTWIMVAFALSVVASSAARGAYTENEVLRRRLEKLEREVEQLRRATGRPAPRQAVSEEEVGRMVEEKIKEIRGPNALQAVWDEGLEFHSVDGAFSLEVGGRIMVDAAYMDADEEIERLLTSATDPETPMDGDAELRRARFFMAGDIYGDTVSYKLQFDFAGSDADLKDAYLQFNELLPFAKVKVGHFKEPFSLEEQTSSKYITFMERGLPNAFSPGRNTGIQLAGNLAGERATWAGGVFLQTDDGGESAHEEGVNFTGRLTGLPYYEEDGRKLLHVGAGASYRSSPDVVGFDSRPEVHLAEDFVDTGDITADSTWLYGLESALVHGPFSVQAEYVSSEVERDESVMVGGFDGFGATMEELDDVSFDGYYVYASYFLTGEHRPYKTGSGSFSRLKPKNNFDGKGNWGAWEVAARYSGIDLDDEDIEGGELSDWTLGLNWYLNPNMRVMFNYVSATLDRGDVDDETADTFMTRFQVDF